MSQVRIYIAYAWDDRAPDVRALTKILETIDKMKIWIDIEHLVKPNVATMEQGLSQSDLVLLFIDEMHKEDKRSVKEIQYIRDIGKLIIPVKMKKDMDLDGCVSFLPANDCQLEFTKDKPLAQFFNEAILHIQKVLS